MYYRIIYKEKVNAFGTPYFIVPHRFENYDYAVGFTMCLLDRFTYPKTNIKFYISEV